MDEYENSDAFKKAESRYRTFDICSPTYWEPHYKAIYEHARAEHAIAIATMIRMDEKAEKLLTLSSALLAGTLASIASGKLAKPLVMFPAVLCLLILIAKLVTTRSPRDMPAAMNAIDALDNVETQTIGQTTASLAASVSCATTGVAVVTQQKGDAIRKATGFLFGSLVLLAGGLFISICFQIRQTTP